MPKGIDTTILFTRENAFYTANKEIWRRNMAAYGGGHRYINIALVRHISEIVPEFSERLKRAHYTNYPRAISKLITQCVLSKRPEREGGDSRIEEDFDRSGSRVDEVMRQFSTYLNVCGCAWMCVDMPTFDGYKTKRDEQIERLRPYCVALSPLDVIDWNYASDGNLSWVLVREYICDNSDPLTYSVGIEVRKLWTRENVTVVARKSSGEESVSVINHWLGCVPFIRHVEVDGYGVGENHWYEDIVRISDSIMNAESESQMNVVKQMFGLLVVPEDFYSSVNDCAATGDAGDRKEPLSHVIARSAGLFESAESKGTSRYISPSGAETKAIRDEIDALRREMYEVVGLAMSRDSRLVESAESKAWDYKNVEYYMQTRADVLEQCEMQAWQMLNMWMPTIGIPKVSYNRNFGVIDMKEAVSALLELSSFCQDNDGYQREIGKTAVYLLNRLRQIPNDVQNAILRTINESSPAGDAHEQKEILDAVKTAMGIGGVDNGGIIG